LPNSFEQSGLYIIEFERQGEIRILLSAQIESVSEGAADTGT